MSGTFNMRAIKKYILMYTNTQMSNYVVLVFLIIDSNAAHSHNYNIILNNKVIHSIVE